MESSIKSLLCDAKRQLSGLGDSARLDAELLLSNVLAVPRSHLHAWPEKKVPLQVREKLATIVARRASGEPMAYLLGEKEFWSLTLRVTADTLIPRPETELLVIQAVGRCPPAADILELGTGSGAVAIAIAHERADVRVIATDVSATALAVASDNASQHGITNVHFELAENAADWFGVIGTRRFDLLVSNPPYVTDADPGLSESEISFEPRGALAAGADGLRDLKRIVAGAPAHLTRNGWLILEHGSGQAEAVTQMMRSAGLQEIETLRDLAGLARVTLGRKASP